MDIEDRLERIEKIVANTAEHQAWMVTWLDKKFNNYDQKFLGIDQRFDAIEQRFDGIDQRFDGIDQRFDGIDRRLDDHDERFDEMKIYIDLKHEDILSNFRAFKEMYVHLSQRVDRLEARKR